MHLSLSYVISPDRRTLTITADEAARKALAELKAEGEDFGSDRMMADAFEHLLRNSELQWIAPERHGDLTDAPILGILNPNWAEGMDDFEEYSLERWGFSPYALRSPLDDLLDTGRAVFTAP